VERVTADLGGDEEKATAALGVLFMSIRLSTKAVEFEHVCSAIPQAQDWVRQETDAATRTGELFLLTQPGILNARLEQFGLTDDQVVGLGRKVNELLDGNIPAGVLAALRERIPLLGGR
jgi:hypothetical protein